MMGKNKVPLQLQHNIIIKVKHILQNANFARNFAFQIKWQGKSTSKPPHNTWS